MFGRSNQGRRVDLSLDASIGTAKHVQSPNTISLPGATSRSTATHRLQQERPSRAIITTFHGSIVIRDFTTHGQAFDQGSCLSRHYPYYQRGPN